MITFKKIVFNLFKYWFSLGSYIMYSYDVQMGAATFHPVTFFNSLNKKKVFYSYIQLCRRPNDISYNNNFYKLQQYYQFQVIIKPIEEIQNLYLNSLKYLGINLKKCDLRFIEDNWENTTLGAYGIGWEVWLDGMEISQITYFQNMAGFNCIPVIGEITYGLERICLYLQKINNIYDIIWDKNKYGYVKYIDAMNIINFKNIIYDVNYLDINFLYNSMNNYRYESLRLLDIDNSLLILSYELAIKMVYYFNLLDSKNCFSKIERKKYILIIRNIFNKIAIKYLSN